MASDLLPLTPGDFFELCWATATATVTGGTGCSSGGSDQPLLLCPDRATHTISALVGGSEYHFMLFRNACSQLLLSNTGAGTSMDHTQSSSELHSQLRCLLPAVIAYLHASCSHYFDSGICSSSMSGSSARSTTVSIGREDRALLETLVDKLPPLLLDTALQQRRLPQLEGDTGTHATLVVIKKGEKLV